MPLWDSDAALLAEQDKTLHCRKPCRDSLSKAELVYTAKTGLRHPNKGKYYRAADLLYTQDPSSGS